MSHPLITRLRAAGCVFAEDEAALILSTARTPADAEAMAGRRAAGLPLEHVLGWAEFHGLRMAVEAGVFVPRRRTEFLAARAAALAAPGSVVLDLCCGTGALGAAVAAAVDGIELHAADIDPAAVRCARRNLAPFGGRVHEGDLYAPLPGSLRGRVDVLIANAPYVPSGEIALLPSEARDHEPLVALDGGSDGLAVQRRVAAAAREWLAPGGHLLVETGARQAALTAALFTAGGLEPSVAVCEERGATVVIGKRPGTRRR
ncbi:putative protein N(5)-glutamine methyltransferase [Streptomyces sp. NPDC049555]|uniref:putative protein N(5)-glutamine methyltransferase n=1 Tax=Streptomyces sp. NPDC049555 TaxID=3154930 RepID=UPI00341C2718